MEDDWSDRLAGARMRVDQQFQDKLEESEFTSQEWGLIMTAVEFEVEYAEDPEKARLRANKEKLEEIIPELQNIQKEMGGSPRPVDSAPTGGSMLGRIKQYLHQLTPETPAQNDSEKLAEARLMTDEYAHDLQTFLEKRDRWDEIRQAAAED